MTGISDAAKAARAKASRSIDPYVVATAAALEATEAAEYAAIRQAEEPMQAAVGVPPPPITHVLVHRPDGLSE